jgi:hypothetical protein
MEHLPVRIPHAALYDLTSLLAPKLDAGPVELTIVCASNGVNLREFTAYFSLIDRVFGRVSVGSLALYSRRRGEQLSVAQFQAGSLETVFRALLGSADAQSLITVWLILKYLPKILRESVAAYKDLEEGRFARAQRRQLEQTKEHEGSSAQRARLRELIRSEVDLDNLSPERVRQLARLLDGLYDSEARRLPAASRFAADYVQHIRLRIGNRELDG